MMDGKSLGLVLNVGTDWRRMETRMDISALRDLYLMNGVPADSAG